jgi:HSP20 family molecular chaperone IbpA
MNDTMQAQRRSEPGPERMQRRPTVNPLVDIYENADEILLVADVPGVAKDQIRIDLEKNQLTLTARREDNPKGRMIGQEWGSRDYYRAFAIPQGIDAEKISADLTDGVLRVHLPKAAAAKPRKIEVRAGSTETPSQGA